MVLTRYGVLAPRSAAGVTSKLAKGAQRRRRFDVTFD
jgi:hypothetical protein